MSNNQDPWGKGNKNDGPPDLDEVFKKLSSFFQGLFNDSKSNGSKGSGGSNNDSSFPFYIIVFGFVAFWVYSSINIIDEQDRGVVLRFGEYHSTLMPGLHFNPYLIDKVETVQVTKVNDYTTNDAKSLMLTQDENIVRVPLKVQYNIGNVKDYVLNVRDPVLTLQQSTDSAIRHVVGSTVLQDVLGEGREQMAFEVKARLQDFLDKYGTGINVVTVTLQRAEPPEQVKEAFDDVNAAEQDKDRLIDQAEAYRNSVLPEARGKAQQMIEEANAYQGELVAKAKGEASRFNQLYAEYKRSPQVTRDRLYLDAIQQIMENSSKVMVDVDGGNNMMYLPLDQLRSRTPATK